MTEEVLQAEELDTFGGIGREIIEMILQRKYFYSYFIQQFRRIVVKQDDPRASVIKTLGVNITDDYPTLFINEAWYGSLTKDEKIAVLEHECVLPNTLILGENKPIESYKIGDTVLNNGKVTHVFENEFNGWVYEIKGHNLLPFEVTGNHPIKVVKRKNRNRKLSNENITEPYWKNACGLDTILKSDTKYKSRSLNLVIPKIKGIIKDTELSVTKFRKNKGNNTKVSSIPLNKLTASFLGLYVAEGCVTNNHKDTDQPFVFLTFHKNETNLHSIVFEFAKSLNISYRTSVRGNSLQIIIPSYILDRALKEWCGKDAHNKKIPDFILLHEDKELLKEFLDYYLHGDGFTVKYGKNADTVSEILAQQLQIAFVRLGILPAIQEKTCNIKCQDNKTHAYHGYHIQITDNKRHRYFDAGDYLVVPIRKVSRRKYTGKVYNLETTTHEYLVHNSTVHNCLHVLNKHLLRVEDREAYIWNLAADIAINQFIKNLPSGPCCPDCNIMVKGVKCHKCGKDLDTKINKWDPLDYKNFGKIQLSADLPTEQYYDLLYEKLPRQVISIGISMTSGDQDNCKGKIQGNGTASGQSRPDGSGWIEVDGEKIPWVMDDHGSWATGSDNKELTHEKIKEMVNKAVNETQQRTQGYMPEFLRNLIDACIKHKTLNWKSELRRFVGYKEFAKLESTRKKRNKRYEFQPGYKIIRKAHVVAAVDSSGSVSNEEFAKFFKEIELMKKAGVNITIIECDAEIHSVYSYKKQPKIKRIGYGGTDFRPPFKLVEKGKYKQSHGNTEFKLDKKADCMIYLTDMAGSYPSKITCPTLWVATKDNYSGGWTEKLGKKIVMHD